MPELIDVNDASVLREVVRSIRNHNRIHSKSERNAILITQYLDFAADVIDKMASGNIAIVRHGQWIDAHFVSGGDFNRCSECGCYIEKTFFANDYNVQYCPNCGAKMIDHIADVSKKVGDDNGK